MTYTDSLTASQAQLLALLVREWERGTFLTYREIAVEMGIRNDRVVTEHLRALERKGWVRLDQYRYALLAPALERSTQWSRVRPFPTIASAPSSLT